MATKKATTTKAAKKKSAVPAKRPSRSTSSRALSTTKSTTTAKKDPRGGLTAAGRKAFAEKEGSHLRPGVQGPVDTPEKMKRKGSFLRRHFANPRGPMQRDGKPTRLALSAHAWGEPVPKDDAAARKLAAKGASLLEKYHKTQAKPAGARPRAGRD